MILQRRILLIFELLLLLLLEQFQLLLSEHPFFLFRFDRESLSLGLFSLASFLGLNGCKTDDLLLLETARFFGGFHERLEGLEDGKQFGVLDQTRILKDGRKTRLKLGKRLHGLRGCDIVMDGEFGGTDPQLCIARGLPVWRGVEEILDEVGQGRIGRNTQEMDDRGCRDGAATGRSECL